MGELVITNNNETRFNPSDLESNRFKRFIFLGKGGEHLVYISPEVEEKKKVAKIDMISLLRATREKIKSGYAPSQETVKPFIEEKNKRLDTLRNYFGDDHVPNQKAYYLNVPINRRLLVEINNKFKGQKVSLTDKEIENFSHSQTRAIVTIQDQLPEFSDPRRISLASGYAALGDQIKTEENFQTYLNVTRYSIVNPNSTEQFSVDELVKIHPATAKVIEIAKKNPTLRKKLKDFVEKSIRYSNETGETLDMAGSDNVIFAADKQGDINFKLPDALYPGQSEDESRIDIAKKVIKHAFHSGVDNLEDWERNTLMNTLNYIRVVNGLAIWLGTNKRINVIPEDLADSITPELLFEAITNKKSPA